MRLTSKFHFHVVKYHGTVDASICFCCLCSNTILALFRTLAYSEFCITYQTLNRDMSIFSQMTRGETVHKMSGIDRFTAQGRLNKRLV